MHYLPAGGGRATAVVAAGTAFSRLAGDRTAAVPDVAPLPARPVLPALTPAAARGPGRPARPEPARDRRPRRPGPGLPGLGARGREQSGVPVTGGARTPFRTATHAIPVRRGPSARPLYVTAGIPQADAAGLVRQMAGRHRLPDAPRRAGTLVRHGLPEPPRRS